MARQLFEIINPTYQTDTQIGIRLTRQEIEDVLREHRVPRAATNRTFLLVHDRMVFQVTYVYALDEYTYERLIIAE